MQVIAVYTGKAAPLPPDGERSAISKQPQRQLEIGLQGCRHDEQADRRVHGGADKAVHQFSLDSYDRIVEAFPALSTTAIAGSLGENISATNMNEDSVYIGDIYAFGSAVLQVCQPRNPCWKINHRLDEPTVAAFIHRQALNGWYYRVLQPGVTAPGDRVELLERLNPVSLRAVLQIRLQHRPALADLEALLDCRGLASELQHTLQQRLRFLRSL